MWSAAAAAACPPAGAPAAAPPAPPGWPGPGKWGRRAALKPATTIQAGSFGFSDSLQSGQKLEQELALRQGSQL